ncbi:SLBB domain-containing protein [candidate division TA06 bacterium]|nr:SLBB domain-containing protein [candidate division TA06 bacterium]
MKILWIFLFLPSLLFGQETGEFVTPIGGSEVPESPEMVEGQERPIVSEDYILHPGDGLMVIVSGRTHFSYPDRITPEGKIYLQVPSQIGVGGKSGRLQPNFEILGEVSLDGLSIKEGKDQLQKEFSRYYKGVQVSLILRYFRRFKVFVVGEVFRPGIYSANPITRVSQVVTRARLKGTSSRGRIELQRKGEVVALVDLHRFEEMGDRLVNPFVEDGDIIHVPPMEASVTVTGAVYGSGIYQLRISALTAEQTRISEGIYELEEGERVSDLIQKAGGVTPWADLGRAYIERSNPDPSHRVKIGIDLYSILGGKDSSKDLEVVNGDILMIPSLEDKVYVEGAVNQPGAFIYQPNLTVKDYIGQAGGTTERAKLSGMKVRGTDGLTKKSEKVQVVKRGDTIIVPRVNFKWWQDYLTVVTAATSLAIAWLTIR